jgi:hypothetical protein
VIRKRTNTSAEVTVEIDEILLVKANRMPRRLHCARCRREVDMLTPEHAAHIAGVSIRKIYAWVEEENLHFAESPDGSLLICRDSLNR